MVVSSPEILIDVTEITPGPPDEWTVNVTVNLKLPDDSVVPAPSGSVTVHLQTPPYGTIIDTKTVDANGRVSFTGVTGAYYGLGFWWRTAYFLEAIHIDTGVSVLKDLVLDSQISVWGRATWPWDPFPYTEAQRQWTNPTGGEGGSEGWPSGV